MTDNISATTLVILSGSDEALDIEALQTWLAVSLAEVRVEVVSDLLENETCISEALLESEASRLVLATCSSLRGLGSIQQQARKASVDPLGIEVVNLGTITKYPEAEEKAKILMAAAVARARAFAGSQPEHAKARFPTTFSRRSLFTVPLPEYQAAPSIDDTLCAAEIGCRSCVDVCPSEALEFLNGKVYHDKNKCEPCGRCVTTCPTGATANPAITPEQLKAQVSALLDPSIGKTAQARGIVFICGRGSAPETGFPYGWMPVELPCVGMATPSWLLAPLLMGASEVRVVPCGDQCHPGREKDIRKTVDCCREFLDVIGASADQIQLSHQLGQFDVENAKRLELDAPFDHRHRVDVLVKLAEAFGAPSDLSLEHSGASVGIVEIDDEACTGCSMCAKSCPTGALVFGQDDNSVTLSFEASLCTACEQCLPKCPETEHDAITVKKRIDLARLASPRSTIYREEAALCISCGAPIAPNKMLKKIEAMLGSEYAATLPVITSYCSNCRSRLS